MALITACSPKETDSKHIRIASHTEPMTTIIELARPELEAAGYTLELVAVSDNTAANLALNNKEIDANFFQHIPFMDQFNSSNNGTLAGVQPIYNARVGFYSKSFESIDQLPKNATIGIPNDPVNQARALLLLSDFGLIELDKKDHNVTLANVINSSYTFEAIDLLTLTHAYEDVDLLFNYPTYIKAINLTPNDALIVENDPTHYYAISLVAREDNLNSEKIEALKKAMTSSVIYDFLTNETNSITLTPSFEN